MRIVSWNINSVRLRAPLLMHKLVRELDPDVICLQETKTPDEHFPHDEFIKLGFPHIYMTGMKGYNGVCVASKIPFKTTNIHHRCGKQDCRHIAVQFPKFELHNIYIPAGGDVPDRDLNIKFAHKLDFIDELTEWFGTHYTAKKPLITLGDFNVAPLENDVWSHKQMIKVISHTPVEVEKFKALQDSLSWVDAIRHFVPEDEKCYTWWSYRNQDWKKSDRGRRLDHIWVTPPLKKYLKGFQILRDARDWDRTSDHVPVMLELDL